jgi:hypothetical protein
MPFYPFLVLEVGRGPQVPIFHNLTYLDPQVGLTRDLGVHHWALCERLRLCFKVCMHISPAIQKQLKIC